MRWCGADGPADGDGFGSGDFGGGTLSVVFRQVLLAVIITGAVTHNLLLTGNGGEQLPVFPP